MNFKHLHYFWVTAKAGGIVRAGEQLHTTPQTLSGQIKLLEAWLGRQLFRKSGRRLELTDEGRLALDYADQIFTLGAEMETALRQARGDVVPPMDDHLLAALDGRLPACAGVALGVDRLLMAMLATPRIADVLAFEFNRA